MSVNYLKFSVSIHGVDIKNDDTIEFLKGWIKTETKAGLLGNQKDEFNFRNFDDNIKVELEEQGREVRKFSQKKVNMKEKAYLIIQADEIKKLEKEVIDRITMGWKCQGGISSVSVPQSGMPTDIYFLQAMIFIEE